MPQGSLETRQQLRQRKTRILRIDSWHLTSQIRICYGTRNQTMIKENETMVKKRLLVILYGAKKCCSTREHAGLTRERFVRFQGLGGQIVSMENPNQPKLSRRK